MEPRALDDGFAYVDHCDAYSALCYAEAFRRGAAARRSALSRT
jgi:hypothetical protein